MKKTTMRRRSYIFLAILMLLYIAILHQGFSVEEESDTEESADSIETIVESAESTEESVESAELTEESVDEETIVSTESIKESVEEEPIESTESTEEFVESAEESTESTEESVEEDSAESAEDFQAENPLWEGEILNAENGRIEGPSGQETYYNLDMTWIVKRMHRRGYEYDYWVREDGVKMLGPYVMCAANFDIRPLGTILETSLGTAIVCDTGGFAKRNPTQLDIAVDW